MFVDNYEDFSEAERKTLERFVTNTSSHIFVLHNLPEVIKGALFSRYSRSNLGLRALLLKEFIKNNEESAFNLISGSSSQTNDENEQILAVQKAQNFYDRILDGYGDDSIGELGGAHIAIENISMLGAKMIEDCRIGGSPLEKSTRYIYFDQKVQGEYLFYREPILMTSAYRDLYIETCNLLFDTYSHLIPPLTTQFVELFPKDPSISINAYQASTRAKVLDCLRGLLPASALTNMGLFANGRFYEQLLHKMHCSNLTEMQEMGKRMQEELGKVIPSFIRRAHPMHHTHISYSKFYDQLNNELKLISKEHKEIPLNQSKSASVNLISSDKDAVYKVVAAILYSESNYSLEDLLIYAKKLPEEEINRILEACANPREKRRHKSPRALEHANFTFEITADFGVYRDLHRHRILTQERQLLSCQYGYYIPHEILGTPFEKQYRDVMERTKEAYEMIARELKEEAQYVVPMAYNMKWYFQLNLRSLQWICELRSAPAGHPSYRLIAQCMAKSVIETFPAFERFFKFVDYAGYDLGRLSQETKKAAKASTVAS